MIKKLAAGVVGSNNTVEAKSITKNLNNQKETADSIKRQIYPIKN